MKKLRAITDRAIVEIIRKRVAEEGGEGGTDLSLAVEQQQKMARLEDQDDKD